MAPLQAVTPIEAALLAGLRQDEHRGDLARLAALSPDEWDAVASLAARQRMVPLLLQGLDANGLLMCVPADVRARLQQRARIATMRSLALKAAFITLAQAVRPQGISLIALKGLHLASGVYRSAGLREMIDIDILVNAEELAPVLEAATGLGYRMAEQVDVSTHLAFHRHLPRLAKRDISLEVHWHIGVRGVPSPPDSAELIARAQPLSLAPLAKGLCPEDLLLHICIHGSTLHTFDLGLRCLSDVRAICDRYQASLQWKDVVSRSQRWGVSRSVLLVLTLAQELLGATVPAHVLDSLGADDLEPHIATTAVQLIFAEGSTAPAVSEQATQLIARGSVASRVRYLWRGTWLPDEVAALKRTSLRPSRVGILRYRLERIGLLLGMYGWRLPSLVLSRRRPVSTSVYRRHAVAKWLRGRVG